MNRVVRDLLGSVDWDSKRSSLGSSEFVPRAVTSLLSAVTPAEAKAAYWQLDNRVVVQGQLFEAAQHVIGPLLVGLQGSLSPAARHRVVDLLVEFVLATPDESEKELGNLNLDRACRQEIERGTWSIYPLLEDPDARVREGSIELLDAVESDRTRLATALALLAEADPEERVRARALEARRRGSEE